MRKDAERNSRRRSIALEPRRGRNVDYQSSEIDSPNNLADVIAGERHVDVVGANTKSVGAVLTNLVLPGMLGNPDFAAFVADGSGGLISGEVRDSVRATGTVVMDFARSPSTWMNIFSSPQMAEILVDSMPTDRAEERQDRDIAVGIVNRLSEKLEETVVVKTKNGPVEEVERPSLETIHQALQELILPSQEGERLSDGQRERLRKLFTPKYVGDHAATFGALEAHIGALLRTEPAEHPIVIYNADESQSTDEDAQPHPQLVNFAVQETGKKTYQLLLQSLLHSVENQTTLGKPDFLVVIDANKLPPEALALLRRVCQAKEISTVFTYPEVDEETAKHIGRDSALVITNLSNGKEAEIVSGVIGTRFEWRETGRSENTSSSFTTDRGTSRQDPLHPIKGHGSSASVSEGFTKASDKGESKQNWPKVEVDDMQTLPPDRAIVVKRGEPIGLSIMLSQDSKPMSLLVDSQRPALPSSRSKELTAGPGIDPTETIVYRFYEGVDNLAKRFRRRSFPGGFIEEGSAE